MESKINKLSMREILSNVGFPVIKNEFRNTYKFDVDLDLAMDFEDELSQMQDIMEIERIIYDYEEIFDKELYIFHLARLLEQDLENLKRAEILGNKNLEQLVFTNDKTGKNKRRFFINAKSLLKTCDVVDIVMKKKSKGEFDIYSSIDFINEDALSSNNRKTLAEEKLYKIEEMLGLKNVLAYFKNSDLIEICKYPNLATLLIVNQDKFEKKVRKYIQYMDIEKMLILANAIYFYRYGETLSNFTKEDAIKLKKFTLAVSEIVGDNIKPITTTKFDFIVDFNDIKLKAQKLVSDKEMLENILEKAKETQTVEIVTTEEPTIEKDSKDEKEINKVETTESEGKETAVKEEQEVEKNENSKQDEERKSEYIIKFVNEENKTIVDVENIKETIMKLDEDSTQEKIEDGTNIFVLPNQKCYVVQPLNKSFYGNATYVIEKELFEKQKERIFNNNKIDLNELENLKANNLNGMVKLVHTGWENSLATFFDMRKDEKYTKEEIENIEKIVYEVKK